MIRANSRAPTFLNRDYKYDAAVAAFIDDFWRCNFRSPSLREIQVACHVPSSSVASNVVRRIARTRGDRVSSDGTSRGITPQWVIRAIQKARP